MNEQLHILDVHVGLDTAHAFLEVMVLDPRELRLILRNVPGNKDFVRVAGFVKVFLDLVQHGVVHREVRVVVFKTKFHGFTPHSIMML